MALGDTLPTSDQLEQTDSDFAGPFEQLIAVNTDDKWVCRPLVDLKNLFHPLFSLDLFFYWRGKSYTSFAPKQFLNYSQFLSVGCRRSCLKVLTVRKVWVGLKPSVLYWAVCSKLQCLTMKKSQEHSCWQKEKNSDNIFLTVCESSSFGTQSLWFWQRGCKNLIPPSECDMSCYLWVLFLLEWTSFSSHSGTPTSGTTVILLSLCFGLTRLHPRNELFYWYSSWASFSIRQPIWPVSLSMTFRVILSSFLRNFMDLLRLISKSFHPKLTILGCWRQLCSSSWCQWALKSLKLWSCYYIGYHFK